MKTSTLIIAFTGLLLFSCQRTISYPVPASPETVPTSLNGTWKMIQVKDIGGDILVTKPSSITGDVIITFVSTSATAGTYTGNTPTNQIGASKYFLSTENTISIPELNMTKLWETEWGKLFADNIRDAKSYWFETGQKLNINTTTKTLTFQ